MIKLQLYDRTKCIAGYLDINGVIQNDLDAYWVTTQMMYVEPNSKCVYQGISYVGDKQYAAWYDKNEKFISSFVPNTDTTEITVPEDARYVRFSLCKHTKINLFNETLEEGSINEISGSNEAGATFTRTQGAITIDPTYGVAQLVTGQTYTISTDKPVYQIELFYYRNTPTGLIYDSYIGTELDVEVNQFTFTLPSNPNMSEVRFRFYTPDLDRDIKVMLNDGTVPLDYQPPTDYDADDRFTFSFEMLQEAFLGFRDDLYKYMKETLSPNLTKGDFDIIIKLMCYIFGDLMGTTNSLKDQIDPNTAEEQYLRHLCNVIGYEWEEGLTTEQQREAIKLFIDIRRRRGTIWSLKNLISVFGQDKISYYSTSDLKGVRIVECMSDARPDNNGLYPGDIMIEIPQFSNILREAIDNIRLIGTRIIFTYIIYVGVLKATSTFSMDEIVTQCFDPAYWGYDPKIKDFGPVGEETVIHDVLDWPIVHRVRSAVSNFYLTIIQEYKTPYERGFIWHEPGNDNYKGFLVDEDTLQDDHTMYGYGTK